MLAVHAHRHAGQPRRQEHVERAEIARVDDLRAQPAQQPPHARVERRVLALALAERVQRRLVRPLDALGEAGGVESGPRSKKAHKLQEIVETIRESWEILDECNVHNASIGAALRERG